MAGGAVGSLEKFKQNRQAIGNEDVEERRSRIKMPRMNSEESGPENIAEKNDQGGHQRGQQNADRLHGAGLQAW
jgi:hypothetical protein